MGKRPGIRVGTPVLTFGTGTGIQNLDRDSRFECGTQKLDVLEQIFTRLDPAMVVSRDTFPGQKFVRRENFYGNADKSSFNKNLIMIRSVLGHPLKN